MSLCVGLVGAGMVAAHHVAGWRACAGADIVAVADPDADRARTLAAGLGVPAHSSLAAMRAEVMLDAVDIVAPVHHHAALVLEAAACGLAVMCQKPLAPSAAEASALIEALPAGARVMVHENWRWRAPYRTLKERLTAPARHFTMKVESAGLIADERGVLPALERQPFLATLPRFLVFEVLIHHLDTLAFLFGPVRIDAARLARRSPAVRGEDYAQIDLSAGSARGRLIGDFLSPAAPPLPRDTLIVDDGRAHLDGWALRIDAGPSGSALRQEWDPAAAYAQSYYDTIAHFAACLATGARFETGVVEGLAALEAVEEVYRLGDFS